MDRTQALLSDLARPAQRTEDIYEAIAKDAAENVGANLVSLWHFDEEVNRITCRYALDLETGESTSGQVLQRSDYPRYFETIMDEMIVCAPDARTHPVTCELAESYFEPNDIISLLDFIVHQDFKPSGIICCESRRVRRDWSEADRKYLLKLATLASFGTRI